MTKTRKIIESLSEDVKTAIRQADGMRMGATVPIPVSEAGVALRAELTLAGLIGPKGGLTMAGSIVATQMFDDVMDEMGMGA